MKQHLFLAFTLAALATAPALKPAAAQPRIIATDLTNIAAAANGGRVLGATSTIDNDKDFTARNLIDGQAYDPEHDTGSKGWASDKFDPINMDYVTIGFKDNVIHKLGRIVLNPSAAVAPERWAKDVEVQVSTETAEGPYSAVAQLTLRRVPQPQSFPILPVDARFVRLVFRSNWGSDRAVALGEVEMYEAIDTSDPLGALIVRLETAVTELTNYRDTQIDASNAGGTVVTPTATKSRSLSPATVQMVQVMGGDSAMRFPVSRVNIASAKNGGKIMGYSSVFDNDPSYGPDKLIDGDNFKMGDGTGSNGWASQGFEPGKQFVTIGFKEDRIKLIGKITLNPASNQSDLRWARRVDVQVTSGSFKDGPWKTVAAINLKSEPVNQDFIIRPVEAKYVRFVFMANGPGISLPNADPNVNSDRAVSLGEIEIYEAVSSGDQLGALIGRFNQILVDLKTLRKQQLGNHDAADAEVAPATLRTKPSTKPQVKATPTKTTRPTDRRRSKAEIAEATKGLVTWKANAQQMPVEKTRAGL
jgi:hypothetical protein